MQLTTRASITTACLQQSRDRVPIVLSLRNGSKMLPGFRAPAKTNSAVDVVVTCTNRKRFVVPPELNFQSVAGTNVRQRGRVWIRRLSEVSHETYPASNVYCGDHWVHTLSLLNDL